MPASDVQTSKQIGAGLILVGAMLAVAALVAALAAADHMAAASLCGPLTRHCILCVAAAASLLASSGVIASGVLLRWPGRFIQLRPARS